MIKIGKYNFDGPYLFKAHPSVERAAVYAVLVPSQTPDTYRVIYIGETGELGTRLCGHHKENCWKLHSSGNLCVAVLYIPSTQYSKEERLTIESELISEYNPVCNG